MHTEEALAYISAHKSEIGTWRDCARLFREQTGETIAAEALRKRISAYQEKEGMYSDDAFLRFEKEKIMFRDERNARNAQVRQEARIDQKFDLLAQELKDISLVQFHSKTIPKIKKSGKSIVVLLSDWHIGLCYDNLFGRYDSDIAKDRIR